jgi:exonuclease 3'-5' domain-containing protein 1
MVMFIDRLADLPADLPSINIDLEGLNLSREGSISLIVLLVFLKKHVYLIDVYSLKNTAFMTAGKDGKTLKNILDQRPSPKIGVTRDKAWRPA